MPTLQRAAWRWKTRVAGPQLLSDDPGGGPSTACRARSGVGTSWGTDRPVGPGPLGDGDGLADRAGLGADHDVVGGLQQGLDAVADHLVVVDQHDPQRLRVLDPIVPGPDRARSSGAGNGIGPAGARPRRSSRAGWPHPATAWRLIARPDPVKESRRSPQPPRGARSVRAPGGAGVVRAHRIAWRPGPLGPCGGGLAALMGWGNPGDAAPIPKLGGGI
jgi:hypothetical protein